MRFIPNSNLNMPAIGLQLPATINYTYLMARQESPKSDEREEIIKTMQTEDSKYIMI